MELFAHPYSGRNPLLECATKSKRGPGVKSLRLVVSLALASTVLLFVCGDFTPYVGDPDRDVWVSPLSPAWRLMVSVSVAVPFAAFSALMFAVTGRVVPRLAPLRLTLSTTPGLSLLVYYYGPFKMLLGNEPPYLVHYELPRSTDRLLISVVCGAGLAVLAGTGTCVWRVAFSEEVAVSDRPHA
jgi:hypothetical protein